MGGERGRKEEKIVNEGRDRQEILSDKRRKGKEKMEKSKTGR